MAASLRHPLSWLAWALMAAVYLPLLPAFALLLPPVFSLDNWRALATDPQLPQALIATLVSTLIAAAGALLLALAVVAALWPGSRWRRLCNHLPWLLAIPHVAFAVSVLLMFAEGGELYRVCSFCSPVMDRYGIGLGVTLAVKESAFVVWAIYASLPEKALAQKVTLLRTLGYSRWQALRWLILPAIAPALGAVMLAVIAWTLSAVDVALILGPGNPPTLAVLAWQWLSQGDAQQQAKGMLVCVILLVLLELIAVALFIGWQRWRRTIPDISGKRPIPRPLRVGRACGVLLPLVGIVSVAILVLTAGNASVSRETAGESLTLGLASAVLALGMILLWLEWSPQRGGFWVWLPLALPALPLVAGQYQLALLLQLDGQWSAVLWGHLLWVLPWMLLVMQPAWRRLDPRLILIARTLGWGSLKIFWLVKCPQMIRPALTAFAVGFSVSMAQYLPTLWLGSGRFATLTTDAVALSSGGNSAVLAAQALWQLLLPMLVFAACILISRLVGRFRQGLR
ncbi:ABC transporter permease subunit [Leclercia adecarboxylata]|uniref:Thiamine ABC transporter permease n=1 Tax=Leclercia adecarboxylata TaxID=83655 RepID=A0A855EH67_9ENTR|nr:ABC transporter permease subunit [Leclercia adecarboxylata]PHH03838.1 thiamine ABC transporter permease [Leclercia adecarboxylata]UBH69560.1 ABC transporter permease subunit [Leclercia adecarboxylata]SPX65025.1 Inner membrane ABC transporter permease protein ynjC [Leclercia adecarboxylata]STX26638.1 Inner membrane ABC transporter permease protein ynjC [Leclercia adecarboxylata]